MKLTKEQKQMVYDEYVKGGWKEKDAKYFANRISGIFELRGMIVEFEKPTINTDFWFSWGQGSFSNPSEAYDYIHGLDEEEYFIKDNLESCQFTRILKELKEDEYYGQRFNRAYIYKKYSDEKNPRIIGITVENPSSLEQRNWMGLTEDDMLTEEETQQYIEALKDELAKFEKRLRTYIKRYGTSNLRFDTYWSDR